MPASRNGFSTSPLRCGLVLANLDGERAIIDRDPKIRCRHERNEQLESPAGDHRSKGAGLRKQIDIIQAIRDRRLFGGLFKSLDTWRAWIVFLKSIFGLPMDQAEIEIYRRCTNRTDPPNGGFKEAACVVGRRGGKSRVGALIGVFIGCFYDFKPYLAPGEVGMILILARNRDQAGVVFGYVKGILENVPALAQMVTAWRSDEIELNNRIVIKVATSDFRGVRGSTCVAAVCDEGAFWNFDSDSANPDT